jgi:hypothetical protein
MVAHALTLKSEKHYRQRVPAELCGNVLRAVPSMASASIRMAMEGRSSARGRKPRWLERASDVRFVDLQGNDDPVLYFEAPTLGEAAEEVYRQEEIWPTRPEPNQTGFDLFAQVIQELTRQNTNSDRFDYSLLRQISRFGNTVGKNLDELTISGEDLTDIEATVNRQVVDSAGALADTTPTPQRVRIAGQLDMVRASTHSFEIKLEDGRPIHGWTSAEVFDRLQGMLREQVVVLGRAVYRPSGDLLRVDADEIQPASGDVSMWSHIPQPSGKRLTRSELRKTQGPRSGVSAILGQWPGDETDEEIEQALEEIS